MDAIRARQESGIETSARLPYLATVYGDADTAFIAHARTDIPALLAYVEELERDLLNERATFESCNRARQHCEHECATLKARTTYTVGETEWAHRIAVAEQRFVDEYDARKAAEREIAELKARITTLEAMKP
jgi:hypothetical protein